MDRIRIRGGNRLNGTIPISGAKNAALPLMITSLLTPGTLTLSNVPRLADVRLLQRILQNHGIDIMVAGKRPGQNGMAGDVMHLTARDIADTTAPYELVSKMRASFWVLGPLLARCGDGSFDHCASDAHPPVFWVDNHIANHLAPGAARERVAQRQIPDNPAFFDPHKAGRIHVSLHHRRPRPALCRLTHLGEHLLPLGIQFFLEP